MKYNDNGTIKKISVKASDTLPIGSVVEYDGEVIPSGWEEVEDNRNVYSTEEKQIGWYENEDGTMQPLYRKKYIINSLPSTNTDFVDIASLKIDRLTLLRGMIHTTGKQNFPVPMYDSADNYSVLIISDSSKIRGRGAIGSGVFKDLEIIIEYTKTTDTPVSTLSEVTE